MLSKFSFSSSCKCEICLKFTEASITEYKARFKRNLMYIYLYYSRFFFFVCTTFNDLFRVNVIRNQYGWEGVIFCPHIDQRDHVASVIYGQIVPGCGQIESCMIELVNGQNNCPLSSLKRIQFHRRQNL